MADAVRLLARARANPASLRFNELTALAEAFGFALLRTRESHRVDAHPSGAVVNVQPQGNMAKRYQVRELLKRVDEHGLSLEDT